MILQSFFIFRLDFYTKKSQRMNLYNYHSLDTFGGYLTNDVTVVRYTFNKITFPRLILSEVPDSYSLLDILNDGCIYLQIKEVVEVDSQSTYELLVDNKIGYNMKFIYTPLLSSPG
jgi:hypothetical protein